MKSTPVGPNSRLCANGFKVKEDQWQFRSDGRQSRRCGCVAPTGALRHRLIRPVHNAVNQSCLTGSALTAGTTRVARLSKASRTDEVLDTLGLPGEPGSLFETALTHRSYAYEQPLPTAHNERLEFLGDAVLGLLVADLIFRAYPDMPEGRMQPLRAAVVNSVALADLARALGLGQFIRLGRGEESTGGRDKSSLLADALEAVIGAAYLEYGPDRVSEVFTPLFESQIERLVDAGEDFDSKGALQELVVGSGGERPSYEVSSSGPEHDKRFSAHVFVRGERYGSGSGRSKKEAELTAAREALSRMNRLPNGSSKLQSISESKSDARAS